MNSWPVKSLKGRINVKHGFPFDSEFFTTKGDYIVLTPGNFNEAGGFKRQAGKEKYYSGEIPDAYLHKKGDLIVAMTEQAAGLLGSCAIVPESGIYLHNQRLGLITTNENEVLKDYIYHIFKTKTVRDQIRLTSSGSKVKHTSPDRICAVKVPLPPIPEQLKIVDLLNLIEKKIELTSRIHIAIEEITKLLYDYWFIQFEFPDASGKPYKSSGGKMVYNTKLKREIPECWSNIKLNDVVIRTGTGLNPRNNFKLGDGENYYITIKDLEQGKINFNDKSDRVNDEALAIIAKRSDLKKGDVLFTSIEPVGVTYLLHEKPKNWDINESVFTIRANPSKVTSEFLFMLLSGKELKSFTGNSSTGSIHKGIRHGVLKSYPFAYSGYSLIEKFTIIIKPTLEKQHNIENENLALINLRAWLLPMLMNGQVKVQ